MEKNKINVKNKLSRSMCPKVVKTTVYVYIVCSSICILTFICLILCNKRAHPSIYSSIAILMITSLMTIIITLIYSRFH